MLELVNISKSYISKKNRTVNTALDAVSAQFPDNGLCVVVGKSGSGKTTLLKLICGIEASDSGEIIIGGASTKEFKERDWDTFRAKNVGFIVEDFKLIEHMNVLGNVASAFSFTRGLGAVSKKEAYRALETVGVKHLAKAYPNELSNEEKQYVCIARAIAKNPEIVLADEPTRFMKSEARERVMKILQKIAENRLVIVATHDFEIADNYANTQYVMKDAKLKFRGDHASYSIAHNKVMKRTKRTSLNILHSLSISFSNMKHHKFRTAMTVLATSLGVIGVCVVLSLQTGLFSYIHKLEETILSSTPITISKYKLSTQTTADEQAQEQIQAAQTAEKETKRAQYLKDAVDNRRVALNNTLASLLSTNGNQNTEGAQLLNDVSSLKKYLDTNPDNIFDSTLSIEYTYDISPVIYSTANNTITEVYPSTLFGSLGTGSSSAKGSKASTSSSAYSLTSVMSDFKPLPNNVEIYVDEDSLEEGRWAQNEEECVLVLNSDGTIDDTLAYTLGLKDFASEVEPLIDKYKNGEKVDYPGIYDSYAYSDIIGTTFKVVNPTSVYEKNVDGTWTDKSSDTDFMNSIVQNNSSDLKIVGVIKPKEDSKTNYVLSSGIYYHPSLNSGVMQSAKDSKIVQEQISDPNTDVLSGKTFTWLKSASNVCERVDFSNIVNIDENMLASCVTLHPEVLDLEEEAQNTTKEVSLSNQEIAAMMIKLFDDPEFQQFIKDLSSSPTFDADVESALAQAGAAYAEYCADMIAEGEEPQDAEEWFSENGDGYIWTLLAQSVLPASMDDDIATFTAKYASRITNYLMQTVETEINSLVQDLQNQLTAEWSEDGPALIEFDDEKFANALKINITYDDLDQLGHYLIGDTSHTYESNLRDFGYATTDTPITCTIYPKTFSDKEKITNVLDKYNNEKRAEDNESQVISFSDLIGTLVSVANKAISVISSLLIAIIITSFFSVVILISIICGISTFQRAREIGILRALGACKSDIFWLFDTESMLIGLMSGAFGVAMSVIICNVINSAVHQANVAFDIAQLSPQIAVGGILISAIVAALAGIIPSLFACRRKQSEEF